jgi:gliding motility-associated-like protein
MKDKILLFIGILLGFSGFSQITSDAKSIETEYSDSNFIFGFCADDANVGSFTANDSSNQGGYNFEWFKFNDVTNGFTDVLTGFTINSDSTQSFIDNLSNGGYKVVLTKIDTVQEYHAWVYIGDTLELELAFYDKNDCDLVGVLANPYYPSNNSFDTTFTYKDPILHTEYTLWNKIMKFTWESDIDPNIVSFNSAALFITNLPWENTTYSLTIEDKFGCSASNDKFYEAIATKAEFRYETIIEKGTEEVAQGGYETPFSGSAPLMVKFTNESKNGENYRWYFGDSTRKDDVDTVFTNELSLEPIHTYYYTSDTGKTYTMELYSESSYGCKDSVRLSLTVLPTEIEFPNVFSPNGDTKNDVFILTDYQSIRDFKITIFNRVGQVVHEFEGDVRDWEGWDGRVKNHNTESPEGTYFFVVEVKGWDNKNYNNKNLKEQKPESGEGEGTDPNPPPSSSKFGVIRLYRSDI